MVSCHVLEVKVAATVLDCAEEEVGDCLVCHSDTNMGVCSLFYLILSRVLIIFT